jgi:hypothetical protein
MKPEESAKEINGEMAKLAINVNNGAIWRNAKMALSYR